MFFKLRNFKAVFFIMVLALGMTNAFAGDGPLGYIGGYKFHDLNKNGEDDSEPRLSGVKIILKSLDDNGVFKKTKTDEYGEYYFHYLPAGKYIVCEIVPKARRGKWYPTTPICVKVKLKEKDSEAFVKFGNWKAKKPQIGCTRTQGFWGNSPAGKEQLIELVGEGLIFGNRKYTAGELADILDEPVKGNALVSLFHQLIATQLNVLAGASDDDVKDGLEEANSLIGSLVPPPVGSDKVTPDSDLGQEMLEVKDLFDDYNNGKLSVPHCDD